MKFEWDAAKAVKNRQNHGVSFEEAKEVIRHPLAITIDNPEHSELEVREKTIGFSNRGRILVVVHTTRRIGVVRIISARKAGKPEVENYAEEIKRRIETR